MILGLVVLAYVVGSTPSSYWVGRAFYRIDLREHGSGNLGATNAFRVLGWKAALPVVLVDVAKGFLPVRLFPALGGTGPAWPMAFGAAAIAGHMFSFWVGFRGGKGIATSAGVFLAMAPLAVLVATFVWVGLTFSSGYVSLGSITAALVLPILVTVVPHRPVPGLTSFTAALALVVVWAHRSNIRRLLRGEENRIRRSREPSEGSGEA